MLSLSHPDARKRCGGEIVLALVLFDLPLSVHVAVVHQQLGDVVEGCSSVGQFAQWIGTHIQQVIDCCANPVFKPLARN